MEQSPHQWSLRFTSALQRIIVGRDAEKIEPDPGHQALLVLPSWLWVSPKVNVGTKGQDRLLPIRIVWDGGSVHHPKDLEQLSYEAKGLGHHILGQTTVSLTGRYVRHDFDGITSVPTTLFASVLDESDFDHRIESLIQDSDSAWWEALSVMEPVIAKAVLSAHGSMASEISGGGPSPLFDGISLEEVQTQLLAEPGRNTGRSSAERLLAKCLEDDAFVKVDPHGFVSRNSRRDAYGMLRAKLGDPHVGSRVRKLSKALGISDPASLLVECQRRYPTWNITVSGIRRALTTSPEATVGAISLDAFTDRAGVNADARTA